MSYKVRVWDLPTRCFHWALALCFVGLLSTAQIGGDAMPWHFRFGYTVLSLLLFRIIWGVVGGKWSRFSMFVFSPASTWGYLNGRGRSEHGVGHNPLGALSVFALLGFLMAQVATGLVSDDEIAAAGPLSKFVSNAMVGAATFYHADVGKLILLGLAALHLGAILFYFVRRRENLVRPMISGDKETDSAVPGSRDDIRSRMAAAVIFLGCAALVAAMIQLAG